jgi:hypothetical protein
LVDDLFEVFDRAHVGEHDVAVLAGDAPAFDNFRGGSSDVTHVVQLPWGGADADHRAQGEAEGAGIELGVVAENDLIVLEALDALGDRG